MTKALLILGELNNDDLDWIIQKSRKETILAGNTLIYEGQKINALYIVLTGSFSVIIQSLGNRELAKISSGEVVGEISFVDIRPPVATVKALEDSKILAIPRLQLTAKLDQDMGFASRFYHGISLCLANRMRGTVRRLGYGIELERTQEEQKSLAGKDELNPRALEHSELAQTRFNWLKHMSQESKV